MQICIIIYLLSQFAYFKIKSECKKSSVCTFKSYIFIKGAVNDFISAILLTSDKSPLPPALELIDRHRVFLIDYIF